MTTEEVITFGTIRVVKPPPPEIPLLSPSLLPPLLLFLDDAYLEYKVHTTSDVTNMMTLNVLDFQI